MTKSLPYMPLFISDFVLKTGHLNFEETGVYMRLISRCWITPGCSIPDDEKWIIRHLQIDESVFNRSVMPILEEFFQVENGRIFDADLLERWAISKNISTQRAISGRAGGQKSKPLNTNDLDASKMEATKPKPKPKPKSKSKPISKPNIPIPLQEEKTSSEIGYIEAKAIDDEPFKRSSND